MDELKPCPFCGESVGIDREYIFCDNCHLILRFDDRVYNGEAENLKEAREQAIEIWNRRVPQTEVHQYGENCTHISNCGTLNLNL